eukprot:scaffold7384_cov396-Prasinococcus_capsulatus_cf.AAC.4
MEMATRAWMEQIATQVEKDVYRTLPEHPALSDERREVLKQLLLTYAKHNPSVGYCQGINFVAGLLLLFLDEEDAFWALGTNE